MEDPCCLPELSIPEVVPTPPHQATIVNITSEEWHLLRTEYVVSNTFSAIFHTTGGRKFDSLITPTETKGGFPLLGYIAT
jgi:hypothetical protein